MIEAWSSRRKKLSAGAALATVLAATGVGLVGPSPTAAADTAAATTTAGDAGGPDQDDTEDDRTRLHGDARYVRFRVCAKANGTDTTTTSPAQDAAGVTAAGTTTSATTSTTSTTTASPTTSTTAPGANGDVVRDAPAFMLLPMKADRATDYRRSERRRKVCYDLDKQQLVQASDTTTATTNTTTEPRPPPRPRTPPHRPRRAPRRQPAADESPVPGHSALHRACPPKTGRSRKIRQPPRPLLRYRGVNETSTKELAMG